MKGVREKETERNIEDRERHTQAEKGTELRGSERE